MYDNADCFSAFRPPESTNVRRQVMLISVTGTIYCFFSGISWITVPEEKNLKCSKSFVSGIVTFGHFYF